MSKPTFSICQALSAPSNVCLLQKHSVIYADRGLIAINKPAGLITQGTLDSQKRGGTIQIALDDIQTVLGMKKGPLTVHRLDKPTTGLYILATTPNQAKFLSRAFAPSENQVLSSAKAVKQYLALVHTRSLRAQEMLNDSVSCTRNSEATRGMITNSSPIRLNHASGPQVGVRRRVDVDLYINRGGLVSLWADVVKRLRDAEIMNALERKKAALSEIEVLGVSSKHPIALVSLRLLTGIKHQLRVTLASYFSAPVVGDQRYGDNADKSSLPVDLFPSDRLMLHSSSLRLERYHSQRPFAFQVTAPLPKDFVKACKHLGILLPRTMQEGGVCYNDHEVTERLRWREKADDDGISEKEGEDLSCLEGHWLGN